MEKLIYTTANSDKDFRDILNLQQANLSKSISKTEAFEQGFVTLKHDLDLLQKMNHPYPHILVKYGDKVVGYALVMLRALEKTIPLLVPLFDSINQLNYKGQSLRDSNYFIMGQICIAKVWRGKGIFYKLYENMAKQMKPHFDYIITEVAARNKRSLRAHLKAGFEQIHEHDDDGETWIVVLLKLK